MDIFSKRPTHGVSFIEYVVARNKVVSARKKVRSAHVEIPVRMREGRKGERLEARRPPIMPRGERVNAWWSIIFIYTKHVPKLLQFSPNLLPVFIFVLVPRLFTVFGG